MILKLPGEHPYEGNGSEITVQVDPEGTRKLMLPDLLQPEFAFPAPVTKPPLTCPASAHVFRQLSPPLTFLFWTEAPPDAYTMMVLSDRLKAEYEY